MNDLLRDALLHFAHFLSIFALASMLAVEVALVRKQLSAGQLERLKTVDRWYGAVAGLVVLTGLSLLFFGAKGSSFYVHNPVFWTKMALFVTVAVLSIPLTIGLARARATVDGFAFEERDYQRFRSLLLAQVIVFVFIPLCATLMANGI